MAWSDSMLDASFRGVTFDILSTRDSVERSVARHGYPYLDGEDVEDLGRRAREFTLSAIFWGDDYEARLSALIQALDTAGPGELVHPVFGSIPECIATDYEIAHEGESLDACTIDITFVEATPGNPFFVLELPEQLTDIISELAGLIDYHTSELFGGWIDALKTAKQYINRLYAIRDVITGTLYGIRGLVGNTLSVVTDVLNFPRAVVTDISGLFGGFAGRFSFGDASFSSDWSTMASTLASAPAIPARVARGDDPLGADTPSEQYQPVVQVLPDDIGHISAVVAVIVATELAANAGATLADEARHPTLSPPEIEHVCNDTREAIQAAIEQCRKLYSIEQSRTVTEPLKDLALAVQQAAIAVIEQSPPLITRRVDADGNLHLLAHRWYGDYQRAAELARLNPQLRDPNNLSVGDVLNVYAR